MIAMVTAAVAAYFYLRVAVLMYAGGGLGEPEGGTRRLGGAGRRGRHDRRRHHRGGAAEGERHGRRAGLGHAGVGGRRGDHAQRADPAGRRGAASDDDERRPSAVPVPALGGLAIALCTGVTVLFGVWPQPLIDFANHATLLFLPK